MDGGSYLNDVTGAVVDSAILVHSTLGPGLLESAYHVCLAYELRSRDFTVLEQISQHLVYRGITLEQAYRLDMLVEGRVVLELKAVAKIAPIHEAQLLSYLKLSGFKVGLLINFHSVHLRDGIIRMVNGA